MIAKINNKIKKDGFKSLPNAILTKIKSYIYKPNVMLEPYDIEMITLGTEYGGKRFFNFKELENSTIISCGLGEDASFDIEFVSYYGGKVIILDPTPRAIFHFNAIAQRIGEKSIREYSTQGAQIVDAYDLSKINKEQLILEKYALWTEKTTIKFFAPKNPKHVSYSITNFQNNYSKDESFEHIEVESITLDSLLDKYNIKNIELLKLDIEGAEVKVIIDMLEKKIFPTQIAVEFDGFNFPSKKALDDYNKVDKLLRENSYLCYDFDGQADFLYVLKNRITKELDK